MCSLVWAGAQAIRQSLVLTIIINAMMVATPAAPLRQQRAVPVAQGAQ
jgi:hypothetical protein